VPSNQVPTTQPDNDVLQSFQVNSTLSSRDPTKYGAFRLQDSMVPFHTTSDALINESLQPKVLTKRDIPNVDYDPTDETFIGQHKTSKKMRKEVHHTTASGTQPLKKINK
jgi:hypothetical protein